MKNHDCRNGFIEVVAADGRRLMRRCLVCAEERFLRAVGRVGVSWESWQEVEDLAAHVKVLKSWLGEPWSVFLHAAGDRSNFGSGKTHALTATAVEWIRRGREIEFRYVPDLVDLHRRAISDADLRAPALGDFNGLLILDDLRSEERR